MPSLLMILYSFIYSFIQAISIAPHQVPYYSEVLPTQDRHCVEFNAESPQATASEVLAHGPYTWWLDRDWNQRPFGRKTSNLPMSPHAQHT